MKSISILVAVILTQILCIWCLSSRQNSTKNCDRQSNYTQSSFSNIGCGQILQRYRKPHRIVGGREVRPGEFPFQVGLHVAGRLFFCGGVIIDEYHILTAAHCNRRHGYVEAVVGAHSRENIHSPRYDVIPISEQFVHYGFTGASESGYDIALMRTERPMNFKLTPNGYGSINSICLPSDNTEPPRNNEPLIVSGFGRLASPGDNSPHLRATILNVVATEKCAARYKDNFVRVHESVMCAMAPKKDSCQGDSGGPLVRKNNGRYELIGIVSYGTGCAKPAYPGIYTYVPFYMNWIKEQLNRSRQTLKLKLDNDNNRGNDTTLKPKEREKKKDDSWSSWYSWLSWLLSDGSEND